MCYDIILSNLIDLVVIALSIACSCCYYHDDLSRLDTRYLGGHVPANAVIQNTYLGYRYNSYSSRLQHDRQTSQNCWAEPHAHD